jgi:DNA polymerase-3 subunit delta
MILKGGEAVRYFAKPDPGKAGLLICGADAMRVALRRQEVIAALVGPEAEAEMRLTRLSGSDLRKDPARLLDAVKAQGFFPGPRAVFVEEATDGLASLFDTALKEWRPGDAQIIVTAGDLKKSSALRLLFEKGLTTFAAVLYDDPPGREEIEAALQKAGLTRLSPEAMADLTTLARSLDPGDFRQLVEKVALYKFNDPTPLTPEEVAALAPATIEAEVDELVWAVADGKTGQIGTLLRRLEGQGTTAVGLCIAALRHFRSLQAVAYDPGGVQAGLARMRGGNAKVREAVTRHANLWTRNRIEEAMAALLETDLTLRSASRAPGLALMERTLIRLAMMARR